MSTVDIAISTSRADRACRFTLPFELVSQWGGMEDMIQQAFQHVADIGPRVEQGHFDLLCDGEIILPIIWDKMIRPDAIIEMSKFHHPHPPSHNYPPYSFC